MTTVQSRIKSVRKDLEDNHPKQDTFTMSEIESAAARLDITKSKLRSVITNINKIKRGVYSFSLAPKPVAKVTAKTDSKINLAQGVSSVSNDEVYVPRVDPTYIKWGEFNSLVKIVESQLFYPVYISGLSGNGKTFMVEQVCAKTKREYIRVQISPETDEDDLIGGFRLINGETVFQKGPVIKAMERGCILLIDEIDRSTNKIMCLQGVLEGNPVLLKKTGEVIHPAPGFNIIATANTKGRGSDEGRFTAASIIDDAFLERFVCTIEQPYPQSNIEKKIVTKHMAKFDVDDNEFADKLVAWSNVIRKTFENDGVEEVVSTRRLCHIVKSYSIFRDREKAIQMCINRFDSETKAAFLDLYSKIDGGPDLDEEFNEAYESVASKLGGTEYETI